MINAGKLLADLKRLRKVLDADLRATHAAGAQRDAVQAEWREAFDLGRTRDTFETFLDGAFDQAVVHWVLGCVFLRFLEDNRLVDRPFLSGPGDRLELAKERQEAHFRALPHDSDTEYLLATFGESARLPGMAGLFDPVHNPLFRLPLSGDGAMALIRFFREVLPETGELAHDFTDPDWDTRFLGDLYQDLSDEARKRYALLQTPDFVESWILDRTLEPAIREFGYESVTMIDPACGSGHFLLGGFARLVREWQRFAPGLPAAEQAQRALDAIAGVDLNPFAVEIARFRLLMAALRAADVHRLAAAPGFMVHVAAGDSLLHGRHFGQQGDLSAELLEGFQRRIRHRYVAEDTAELDRVLGKQYHAVVGNPPYITPKDAAMRDAYRDIFVSCHKLYSLAAPFIERFFDLANTDTAGRGAGFIGLIVANSFMKREFGKKLVGEVLPRLDLTHIVDTSGAYIPGHGNPDGTPTAILFGRNRRPSGNLVRAVLGIKGEPEPPVNLSEGLVWQSILRQVDNRDSTSEFVSVRDIHRETLARHPWSIGGGGVSEVRELIEANCQSILSDVSTEIGRTTHTGEDEFFVFPRPSLLRSIEVPMVLGECVRDYTVTLPESVIFPYDRNTADRLTPLPDVLGHHAWAYRTTLKNRRDFGQTIEERGLAWYEHNMFFPNRWKRPLGIAFPFVATHNHFVLDRGGKVFNRTAPVIKLRADSTENDHLRLLGLLNSSIACFWARQVLFPKGGFSDGKWEERLEWDGSKVSKFPIADGYVFDLAKAIDDRAQIFAANIPDVLCAQMVPLKSTLEDAHAAADAARMAMIALQEELDWRCYRLYGLLEVSFEHQAPPPLNLGERAFEIVMARRMEAGNLDTAWFDRHGSTPVVDIPLHWPDDYRAIVERRIALIETDPTIGLVERPESKRRWVMSAWETMERDALRIWLLDRLEAADVWTIGQTRLVSTNQLTDLLRRDDDFLSVAALFAGRADVNLEALVAELVAKESVPFLAGLRYAETGLRKRVQWEATWDKQRREDAIDADVIARRDTFRAQAERRAQDHWQDVNRRRPGEEPEPYAIRMQAGAGPAVEQQIDRLVAEEQRRRKRDEVGDVPVPPKYVSKDFQSADFWRLRGGLDVPKERFVSFPHCQRDADGSLVVTWAGHNHLKRALAIAAYYQERKDSDGWPAERLMPLLAGVIELVPWLLQWHNEYDPDLGARMGDYFVEFVQTEARALGMTEAAVAAWTPPATPRRGRTRRAA